jgi:hypothetical protein
MICVHEIQISNPDQDTGYSKAVAVFLSPGEYGDGKTYAVFFI